MGEINGMEVPETELAAAISNARLRLDAVRLIWKSPPK